MVLSDKVNHEAIILMENLSINEPKTKKMVEMMKKLPLKDKSTLIILDKKDDNIIRSCRNLPLIDTLPVESLNVVDLLKFEYLLTTVKAIKRIETIYQ